LLCATHGLVNRLLGNLQLVEQREQAAQRLGRGIDLVVIGASREGGKFPDQFLDLAVAAE